MDELSFNWLTGFECSYPRGVDELAKTQHYTYWASDLLKVKSLGVKTLRYGVPWHLIHTAPSEFDWSWMDGPMQFMRDLELEPIVDLVHFGTPEWLADGFASAGYPVAAAEFARAFATRYPWVRYYTCVNEPSITTALCGELQHWFPYGKGERSFVSMLEHVARSVILMTWAVRDVRPDARFVWVDTGELHHGADEPGRKKAAFLNKKRFIAHDLIWGRVGEEHELRGWLRKHGMSEDALAWFSANGVQPDILGLDYYIQSEMLYRGGKAVIAPKGVRVGIAEVVREYYRRYNVPVMITETDRHDTFEVRLDWLEDLNKELLQLRREGIPMVGCCWWPAVDHIDWDTGLTEMNENINPVGLYQLVREQDGRLSRVETVLTQRFREVVAASGTSVPAIAEPVVIQAN